MPAAGHTRLTRLEAWAAIGAMALTLVLAPFVLAGIRLALDILLAVAGATALTAVAWAAARLTESRAAVVALCVTCALAAFAVLLVFPTFEIVGGEVRNKAWPNLARGVAYGAVLAAAVANSRFKPRPRRPRRESPPGAP